MSKQQLTDKQRGVLMFMERNAKLRYPTVRAVAKYFGICAATAHDHIKALKRKGKLK